MHVDDSLQLVNPPYLKAPSHKKFTLVLDLDETLLHYMERDGSTEQHPLGAASASAEGVLNIRPGADEFL